jgi:hypothetical protein
MTVTPGGLPREGRVPEADVDVAMLAAAIDAINDCAQACIADTGVDLSG